MIIMMMMMMTIIIIMGGLYIWYSEERPAPNVTAHPSTSSVPVPTSLFDVAQKMPLHSKGLTPHTKRRHRQHRVDAKSAKIRRKQPGVISG